MQEIFHFALYFYLPLRKYCNLVQDVYLKSCSHLLFCAKLVENRQRHVIQLRTCGTHWTRIIHGASVTCYWDKCVLSPPTWWYRVSCDTLRLMWFTVHTLTKSRHINNVGFCMIYDPSTSTSRFESAWLWKTRLLTKA